MRVAPVAGLLALCLLAVPAAQAASPRIAGAPLVTYATVADADGGTFVSLGVTVRLTRPFADADEQRGYSVVVAPRLRRGQLLPDELFGGTSLGRVGVAGACYAAEAVQLRRRGSVRRGARWDVALARGSRIVGPVRTAMLVLASGAAPPPLPRGCVP